MFTLTIEDKNGVIADEFCFNHGTYLIGRVEGNDIILPSSKVSRQHARIFVRDNRCFVEDLGSSNGVIVDGQRIQGERDLGTASQIRIGDFYLYLALNKDQGQQPTRRRLHPHRQPGREQLQARPRRRRLRGRVLPPGRAPELGRPHRGQHHLPQRPLHLQASTPASTTTASSTPLRPGQLQRHLRINDKRISAPTVLREGDRISFGNLHFVFMPSSKHLAPENMPNVGGSDNKKKSGIGIGTILAILAVLGFLLFLLLAAVGGGYYFLVYKKAEPAPEVPKPVVSKELTDEQKIEGLLTEGQSLMQSNRWEDAISKFDEALKLDAKNAEAEKLKKQATTELEGQKLLDDGIALKGKKQYDEARKKLLSIPSGTNAQESAKTELENIEALLVDQYRKEARALSEDGDLLGAHKKLTKVIDIKCNSDVKDQIQNVEADLTKKKKSGWDPIKIPPSCK
jgi:pSer/pThr/pTyr-binding forkhead associated (FHA) protein/outer membrane protein assembly factor BamD (BamD/ComL family)